MNILLNQLPDFSYQKSIYQQKHKVFISYHHLNDQYYRNAFEKKFSQQDNIYISKSVQIGDFSSALSSDYVRHKIRDDYLRDTTVTIVLIGENTWQRKHVDWEISSSIRYTKHSTRSGLIGILLPTHPSFNQEYYDEGIIPPRLADNQRCGYAKIYKWSNNSSSIKNWINDAFHSRNKIIPDNSYPHFLNNKFGRRWK